MQNVLRLKESRMKKGKNLESRSLAERARDDQDKNTGDQQCSTAEW
jgi:hypothetical protein